MEFLDAGGDKVLTREVSTGEGARLIVECAAAYAPTEFSSMWLTPEMARSLAADLIAFADSAETEVET